MARIRRPQGRRGEVIADLLTDFPERFEPGSEFFLWKSGASREKRTLEEVWFHKDGVVLKFSGTGDISSAELWAGWEVQVPLSGRVKLKGDAVYVSDLIGCEVWEAGTRLGTVSEVDDRSQPVLIVETPQGELLVPFAGEICLRVDVTARRIEVALPPGLRDLNSGDLNSGDLNSGRT